MVNFIAVDKRYMPRAPRPRFVIFNFVHLGSVREIVQGNIWKSKTTKGLFIVVILLIITMIVLVAVTFLLMSSFQEGNCEETCQTKSCTETAERVLSSMNETVHPCDDFFEFACRGWITNNPIPKHEMSWSATKIIDEEIELQLYRILNTPDKEEDGKAIKMARELYRSCMHTTTVGNPKDKLLTDAFTKLGLSKSPPTDEEAANLDISKIAGLAMRHYGILIFVDPVVSKDSNNNSVYRLELEQLSPEFDHYDVYLRDPVRYKSQLRRQKIYIRLAMRLAGMKNISETYATEIMNFTTEIANIMAPPEERAMSNYTYQVMTISELQNLTDPDAKHWNWTTYMNALFEETDVIVDPDIDTVYIRDMGYFKSLPLLLSKISPGIAARFSWYELQSKLAVQTRDNRDYGAAYGRRAYGFEATWYGCTQTVRKFFDMALTAAYVEKHFNVQNKISGTGVWIDVISSFDEMLTEYKWMDDETKAQAQRKLRKMSATIAYPEWITDREKLEEFYKEYEGIQGSLVDVYRKLKSIKRQRKLNRWKQPTDRNTWSISATEANAKYTARLNTITIRAGALHEPFYGNASEALNYGALGAMMGHELTHGFDLYGQRYDENGTHRQWWSSEALKYYDEKADCVMKQYSEYTFPQLGKRFKLDGIHTETENVADIGGVAVALRAYKKMKARSQPLQVIPGLAKYTDEQLFFIGYAQVNCDSFMDAELKHFIRADPHSPGRFRVIGALQNSDEFAKVWNCPSSSAMNPAKKCNLW